MRGTLVGSGDNGHSIGIIPAYAGNTNQLNAIVSQAKDHPRVCGEHTAVYRKTHILAGIIPAYAGNTFSVD